MCPDSEVPGPFYTAMQNFQMAYFLCRSKKPHSNANNLQLEQLLSLASFFQIRILFSLSVFPSLSFSLSLFFSVFRVRY